MAVFDNSLTILMQLLCNPYATFRYSFIKGGILTVFLQYSYSIPQALVELSHRYNVTTDGLAQGTWSKVHGRVGGETRVNASHALECNVLVPILSCTI